MQVCNHEEADTRIFVHVRDAVEHGAQNVLIRTVDTDVVVIAVVKYSNLCLIRPDVSVWMAFAWEKISSIYQSTPSARHWGLEKQKRFYYSMPSLAAMPHRPSREKGKSLRGTLGMRMKQLIRWLF